MLGTVAACEKLRNLDIGRSTARGGVGFMLYQDAPRVGLTDQMPSVAVRAVIKLSRTRCRHRHHSCFALGIHGVGAPRLRRPSPLPFTPLPPPPPLSLSTLPQSFP